MKEIVSIHDRYRFEIKIDLLEYDKYNIEYYFFLPSSLNISHYTYDKSQFYSSIQRYIRYKNPEISVNSLFDLSNELSPFNRATTYLENLKTNPEDSFIAESAIDEMKLLGSIIKEEINRLYLEFEKTKGQNINDIFMTFSAVEESFEELKKKINSFAYPQRISNSLRYVDEYVNLLKIETFSNIIKNFKDFVSNENSDRIFKWLGKLKEYSNLEKYVLISEKNRDFFLYYRGLLKKFVSSCLFLKAEPSFNLYYHLVSGVASAVAMLFAIVVMIYAQVKYSVTSLVFVIIAVVSYVFKDRIKEFVKIAFSKGAGDYIYDRKIKITEPAHNIKIGYIKESFSILGINSIDKAIVDLRNKDNSDVIDEDAKSEVVLKYKKTIKLNHNIIGRYHTRRKRLVNILRFSIEDFIKHTDDAEVEYAFFSQDNSIDSFKVKKTYHLNLVVKYFNTSKDVFFDRYRIIFNRSGIMKVEKVF